MSLYLIANGPAPLGSQIVPVTTGAVLKTMLQFRASATKTAKLVAWAASFKGFAAAEPIRVDVVEHDNPATVTAHVEAGLNKYDAEALLDGNPTTNLIQVGITATGYSASAEGTAPTVARLADSQLIAPTNQNLIRFPLGEHFLIQTGKYLKLRVLAPAAVDMYCWFLIRI